LQLIKLSALEKIRSFIKAICQQQLALAIHIGSFDKNNATVVSQTPESTNRPVLATLSFLNVNQRLGQSTGPAAPTDPNALGVQIQQRQTLIVQWVMQAEEQWVMLLV
jgi:hypothetical protein